MAAVGSLLPALRALRVESHCLTARRLVLRGLYWSREVAPCASRSTASAAGICLFHLSIFGARRVPARAQDTAVPRSCRAASTRPRRRRRCSGDRRTSASVAIVRDGQSRVRFQSYGGRSRLEADVAARPEMRNSIRSESAISSRPAAILLLAEEASCRSTIRWQVAAGAGRPG